MGELPPLHTPQGPGIPRALRPRFPRVDSSGTSRVPPSRSVISHLTHLLSPRESPPSSCSPFPLLAILTIPLHGPIQLPPRISPPSFARVSLRFLPFPCVQFSPLCSPRRFQVQSLFSFHEYLFGIVLCLGLCFPRCRFGYVFLSFLLRFLQFPSLSFPFLASSSLQFSPLSSSSVLPSSSRPHGDPTLPRSSSESRVLPPLFRGSVSVARGSRRGAPTPLQRSGKVHRESGGN